MRFLGVAYMSLGREAVFPIAEFAGIFKRVRLNSEDFTPENFKPGTSGQAELPVTSIIPTLASLLVH